MTTFRATNVSGSTPRLSGLSAAQIADLKPHIINLGKGKFSPNGEIATTRDDVDAVFREHLPKFAKEHPGIRVPVVLYAHGGLVDEGAGLRIAQSHVAWWKSNGVYPIHFIWETGLAGAISGALTDWITGRRGWLDEAQDRVLELAARFGQGQAIWEQMKDAAKASSDPGGGAKYAAEVLGSYCTDHPGTVTLHAVGHSAGSIFHSHFIPAALASGVPEFETVSLLAPAVRVDLFKSTLMPEVGRRIKSLAMFTMNRKLELDDTCLGVYGKSLLYLIRASLEPEQFAPILGLEECVLADAGLSMLFGESGSDSPAEVVWSTAVTGPLTSQSASTSHGGFDNDAPTMDSVARRVTGTTNINSFAALGAVPAEMWPAIAAPTRRIGGVGRRALCIGINRYPGGNELFGCVADAEAWAGQFEAAGFSVQTMLDERATRESMLLGILELVSSSAAGDVLVVQYAGHGTYVDDLDRDEVEPGHTEKTYDEALCPIDFQDGNLIIDDDLGEIFDILPADVNFTAFFDSCHSGDGTRMPPRMRAADLDEAIMVAAAQGRRPRFIVPDEETVANFLRRRGTPARNGKRANAREVLFSACQPDEVAYETGGHGDFTAAAGLLVGTSVGRRTNEEFLSKVLDAFSNQPRQTPAFNGLNVFKSMLFLAPFGKELPSSVVTTSIQPTSVKGQVGMSDGVADGAAGRAKAAAAFLRATAEFIDS
jgi:hypothetical protein